MHNAAPDRQPSAALAAGVVFLVILCVSGRGSVFMLCVLAAIPVP